MKDPIKEYLESFRQMSADLNQSLQCVKVWMSSQHFHNEIFMENINDLRVKFKELEKEINELKKNNE